MTITRIIRSAIRSILEDSNSYDASTMRISRTGEVSALKDADKTFAGNDPVRYLVGHAADMVTAEGERHQGW